MVSRRKVSCEVLLIHHYLGPNNRHVEDGAFANDFRMKIGKTHVIGRSMKEGDMWQAHRKLIICWLVCTLTPRLSFAEVILKTILEHGRDVVTPYTNQQNGLPDPSYVLSLPNEVLAGSNVFGVQKHFDGPFQFDVIFDSASNTQKITRTIITINIWVLY